MFKNKILILTVFALLALLGFFYSSLKDFPTSLTASVFFEDYYLQLPQILVVDSRSRADFENGHISGAISDPFCKLKEFGFLFSYQPVLIVGMSNLETLKNCQMKYRRIVDLVGDYPAWVKNGYPVSKGLEQPIVLKKGCSSLNQNESGQECL